MAAVQHPLGPRLLAEVDDVVMYARAGGRAKLDIQRVAARLDVRIVERDLGEHLLGLTVDAGQVLLHERLAGAHRAFIFAHEAAHVLRRRGRFRDLGDSHEEWFADWFARELVLPRRAARHPWTEAQLAALHVSYNTVALQLAALGEAPPLMRNGDKVLCRQCGTTSHQSGCDCLPWRQDDAEKRYALPDVRGWVTQARPRPDHGPDYQLRIDGVVYLLECKFSGAMPDERYRRLQQLRQWAERSFGRSASTPRLSTARPTSTTPPRGVSA